MKALIIIDYIFDFVHDNGKLSCKKPAQIIEKNIINLIKEFKNDFIVVANDFHDENEEYHAERENFPKHCYTEKGRELFGDVKTAIEKHDKTKLLCLNKSHFSAFAGTSLDMKLRERKVDELCLVGVCTDICVLHTAIDAYNLGYNITVPKNAVASFDEKAHDFALSHIKNTLGGKIL